MTSTNNLQLPGESTVEAPGDDRRRFRRVPTDLIAHFRRGGEESKVMVSNMSLGGIFVETKMLFEDGETVEFDLMLPAEKHGASVKVHVTGAVSWTRKNDPSGIGVEIKCIAVQDKLEFHRYMRRIGGYDDP